MEYFRIKTITEADFDSVIIAAGGRRIPEEGSADYILNEALLELKLVEEEGFEKTSRQNKLATLFKSTQLGAPTVIIDPEILDATAEREYYNVVAKPIKRHVKKASSQLEVTRKRIAPHLTRVLVLLNNGYTALSEDEFKRICVKCVHNDTKKIDFILCGGLYYFSDKFDFYFIAPLELIPINLQSSFPSASLIQEKWGELVEKLVTDIIKGPGPPEVGKMPVLDLVFDIDGVRYVKPSPQMPRSTFWPSGKAPREDTSPTTEGTSIAIAFPSLSEEDWTEFKKVLRDNHQLRSTYIQWRQLQQHEENKHNNPLKPLVPVEVTVKDFAKWVKKSKKHWLFADVCEFATEVYYKKRNEAVDCMKSKEEVAVIPLEYIYCVVRELGQDKANDFASLLYVSEIPGFQRKEILVKNTRLTYEHAVTLALTYAVKLKVANVIYDKTLQAY